MRLSKINSFHNTASFNQAASNRQSTNVFASNLQVAAQSRIVTEKKEGYIRRYRVHADGSRELLSEELDTAPAELLQQLTFRR